MSDVVREKDLYIGDTILVERAGDVIPYIVKPLVQPLGHRGPARRSGRAARLPCLVE